MSAFFIGAMIHNEGGTAKHDVKLLATAGVPTNGRRQCVTRNAIPTIAPPLQSAAARARMLNETIGAVANAQTDPADEVGLVPPECDVRLPAKQRDRRPGLRLWCGARQERSRAKRDY
jgi:hypothetical protein